jgi:hypothetical protein
MSIETPCRRGSAVSACSHRPRTSPISHGVISGAPAPNWPHTRLIAAVIAEKNAHLPKYRKIAGEVWLLIVNDLFLGPGEVCARKDHLAEWTFTFDFDKVLLFSRQPGNSGEVIELRSH